MQCEAAKRVLPKKLLVGVLTLKPPSGPGSWTAGRSGECTLHGVSHHVLNGELVGDCEVGGACRFGEERVVPGFLPFFVVGPLFFFFKKKKEKVLTLRTLTW